MADKGFTEVPETLSKWFTHDEWKHISYCERKRTLNILENYHTLTGLVPSVSGFFEAVAVVTEVIVVTPDLEEPSETKRNVNCQYTNESGNTTPGGEKNTRDNTENSAQPVSERKQQHSVTEKSKEQDQYSFRDADEVSSLQQSRPKPVTYELRKQKAKSYREDRSSDDDDDDDYRSEVHRCSTCRLSFSSASYRDRHDSHRRRRCKSPSKVSCATAIKPVHGVLSKESGSGAGLRHSSTKNYASKIRDNTNPNSCIRLNPCSQGLCGKEDFKCKYVNKKCANQGNVSGRNMNRLRSTQNDICISSGTIYYSSEDKMKCSENSKGYNESFSGTTNLNSQEPFHPEERTYKCTTCNKPFSDTLCLHRHEKRRTEEQKYKCTTCNKTFSDASYLNNHERIHTGERLYKCSTYTKAFSNAYNFHINDRSHTRKRPYKCNTCKKTFFHASNLHIHKLIHTGKRPYKCNTCNKAFSDPSCLHRHARIHTGERPYKCSTCNKAFSQASTLRKHERIHTGESHYKCSVCNQAFSRASQLHSHKRIHTGEHPYKCSICNKVFSQASNLRKHERIHTGERPYKCITCNKAFSDAYNLHIHERSHTGKRPYKCDTCKKTFSYISNLHTHERIHTGERPYKCNTCNKAFSDPSCLHRHARIHTGERPYKCSTCNKAYSQASTLRKHERIHTRNVNKSASPVRRSSLIQL